MHKVNTYGCQPTMSGYILGSHSNQWGGKGRGRGTPQGNLLNQSTLRSQYKAFQEYSGMILFCSNREVSLTKFTSFFLYLATAVRSFIEFSFRTSDSRLLFSVPLLAWKQRRQSYKKRCQAGNNNCQTLAHVHDRQAA